MALKDLINLLEQATGADRKLDTGIAVAVGYRQKVEQITENPGREPTKRVLWIVPTGEEASKVPYYTGSIDVAYQLARMIAPSASGGCAWADGMGYAVINDGPRVAAATPAIALCIAALREKMEQESGID